MNITPTELRIRRLTGNIGAEISGVSLSADLPAETIAEIRAAALANKVVFFRDQHHLDDAGQLAFGARFGTVTRSFPTSTGTRASDVLEPSSRHVLTYTWHTDSTFVVQPPSFSMLRSVVIPELGGDTLWANTATAYAALPTELHGLADRLWAMHTNHRAAYPQVQGRDPGLRDEPPAGTTDKNGSRSSVFKTAHPVVRVHPETNERCLLLGAYARGFVGYDSTTFEALGKILQDVITRPEHTVRWNWQVGDLAIWDNRASQHYAVHDYGLAERRVRRVTIAGQIPVSIDGETSRAIQGDSSAYNRHASGQMDLASGY